MSPGKSLWPCKDKLVNIAMVGYIEGAQIKHLDTDVGQKGAHASV